MKLKNEFSSSTHALLSFELEKRERAHTCHFHYSFANECSSVLEMYVHIKIVCFRCPHPIS